MVAPKDKRPQEQRLAVADRKTEDVWGERDQQASLACGDMLRDVLCAPVAARMARSFFLVARVPEPSPTVSNYSKL
jgi:hypothetical protein